MLDAFKLFPILSRQLERIVNLTLLTRSQFLPPIVGGLQVKLVPIQYFEPHVRCALRLENARTGDCWRHCLYDRLPHGNHGF